MNIMIVDTETTGLDKPFCYDVGYIIYNTDTNTVEEQKHFVIEQVWHNLPLFETAYYKEKRPLYVQLMRQHKAIMTKWGYAMREMRRDIQKYNVSDAYAYNSAFDDKVINFNSEWFKCINPLDNIAIHDIWGYASEFITNTFSYQQFCEEHSFFTDTGNYKGSAEVVYRYITNDVDFEEAHMGLCDVHIETTILLYCLANGALWNHDYTAKKILPRMNPKDFTIKLDKEIVLSGTYLKKTVRNDVFNFIGVELKE